MEKIIETTSRALMLVSVFGGMAMAALVVLGVAMRYFVGSPLAFSDELVGLLFVLIAFAILPSSELRHRNISVTLITDMMSPRLKTVARIARLVLVIAFALAFSKLAIDFAITSATFGARMDSLNVSIVPWILIIPIAALLAGLIALVRLFRPDFGPVEDDDEVFE